MSFKESSLHLFQPPKFRSKENFYESFNEALKESNNKLNLDIASLQSFFSLNISHETSFLYMHTRAYIE